MVGSGGLDSHVHARYRVPDCEPFLEHRTVSFCTKAMTVGTEMVSNRSVCGEKSLRMAGRFEATHRSFALRPAV
jgi:hypothetical protein